MAIEKEVYEFDAIIIGAGIVGLATAYELSKHYNNVLVVEKEDVYGKHISSRNSEVIHSGVYYNSNSLKAQLCVRGNQMMYDFARKYNIKYSNCGKLIIINNIKEFPKLEQLMENGIHNGVEGLQILTQKEVELKEPLINSYGALFVPSTGIIDSHSIMAKLEYLIKSNNANIVYNLETKNIQFSDGLYTLSFKNIQYVASSSIIVNSTGLWCDKISSMVGINDYQLHLCKGEYYKTSKFRNQIKSLIYPLPTEISLGTHAVLHLDGTIGFGPNAYYTNKIDYSMDSSNKKYFLSQINKFLKLNDDDITEDFAGIRPKIQKKGDPSADFIIINEFKKGYKNFINLIGIESPGLTSSLAIAKYVYSLINR